MPVLLPIRKQIIELQRVYCSWVLREVGWCCCCGCCLLPEKLPG